MHYIHLNLFFLKPFENRLYFPFYFTVMHYVVLVYDIKWTLMFNAFLEGTTVYVS